jgi:hypothetical protein
MHTPCLGSRAFALQHAVEEKMRTEWKIIVLGAINH